MMRAVWWWVDRWRKSTAYTDMTAEEQGLYRNLLDEVWHREGGVIPDDPWILARVSGDSEAWKRSGAKVLRWMRRVPGGWTNDTALEVQGQSERRAVNQRNYRERFKLRAIGGRQADNGPITNPITERSRPDNGAGHKSDSPSPSPSPSLDLDLSNDPDQGESSTPPISREPKATEVAAPPLDQGFAEFWAVYPRKVGKGAAEKVWKRLHPSARTAALMRDAVEHQKTWPQWTKDGGQFIPHPATWLNQARWDDERPEVLPETVSARTRQNAANAMKAVEFIQERARDRQR